MKPRIMAFRGKSKPKAKPSKKKKWPEKYDVADRQDATREKARAALEANGGKIKLAAQSLGVNYHAFWQQCNRLGLLEFAKGLRKGERK